MHCTVSEIEIVTHRLVISVLFYDSMVTTMSPHLKVQNFA